MAHKIKPGDLIRWHGRAHEFGSLVEIDTPGKPAEQTLEGYFFDKDTLPVLYLCKASSYKNFDGRTRTHHHLLHEGKIISLIIDELSETVEDYFDTINL